MATGSGPEVPRGPDEDRAPAPPRLLRRSKDDRMIAGVCGGIAEYFNLDPVLVRIAFVVVALAGPGLLVYVVAWILLPAAPGEGTNSGTSSSPSGRRNDGAFLFGVILLAAGSLMILWQFAPDMSRRFFWPFALILLGVVVMAGGLRRDRG